MLRNAKNLRKTAIWGIPQHLVHFMMLFELLVRKNWPFWLAPTKLFYKYGSWKVAWPQNTTTKHKTHAATKMSRPPPYPPPAFPYLHGNTCHGPSFWCRRFLLVNGRRVASGLLSPPLVPLFGATKSDPSTNREMGGALTLGGRGSTENNNNQLGVGVGGGKDVGEDARVG